MHQLLYNFIEKGFELGSKVGGVEKRTLRGACRENLPELRRETRLERLMDSWLVRSTDSGRGTARAEDDQGAPTQSHISPSLLVYEEYPGQVPVGIRSNGYDMYHTRLDGPFPEVTRGS